MIAFSRDDNSYLSRWWWTVDRVLLSLVGVMLVLGLLMTLTASTANAERIGVDALYFFKRQGMFLILSAGVLVAVSLLSEKWLRRFAGIGFLMALIAVGLTLVIGREVNGAQRWLSIAGTSLQASEFLKPFFAVVTAWILSAQFSDATLPVKRVVVVPLVLICGLLMLQPDFGQTVLILSVWMAQLALAGMPLVLITVAAVVGIALLVVGYFTSDHVYQRINGFLDPSSQDTYQMDKALEAMGSGGLLGRGMNEGVVKLNLPDAHTDYIFAVIGEEFGAIACLMLLLLYAGIVLRTLASLMHQQDPFRFLAAAGLIVQFGLQAIINIGVNLALLPSKGMTLPFISYGGSSLLALAIGMGMLLALTRRNRYQRYTVAHRFGTAAP